MPDAAQTRRVVGLKLAVHLGRLPVPYAHFAVPVTTGNIRHLGRKCHLTSVSCHLSEILYLVEIIGNKQNELNLVSPPWVFFSPPLDALLFPGRLRPGKRSASIGRRLYKRENNK